MQNSLKFVCMYFFFLHNLTCSKILGCGSGGWHDRLAEKFATALPNLKQLVHFSFRYDCTKSVLEVLSQTCNGTLRILDIERSRHVEDDSVDLIKTCNRLTKINFFLTGFSTEAMVIIIIKCKPTYKA